jgi:hypothetical protein
MENFEAANNTQKLKRRTIEIRRSGTGDRIYCAAGAVERPVGFLLAELEDPPSHLGAESEDGHAYLLIELLGNSNVTLIERVWRAAAYLFNVMCVPS